MHQESPRSDVFRKRATKPLSEPETTSEASYLGCGEKELTVAQWSKVLFSDESKFCISFGNQGPRVWRKSGEAQNPCLLEVQCEVSTVSDDLGCHVICWCWSTVFLKSTVNAAIYQEILEHFMLPSADKLYGDADFISSRTWHLPTLPKVPKAGSMTMVLLCLIGQQTLA